MRLKSYTNNSRNAIDPSGHPRLVDPRDEYLANLWQLVGLLRETASAARRCANHSRGRVARGRLFAIETRIDTHLREILQHLPPDADCRRAPRIGGAR